MTDLPAFERIYDIEDSDEKIRLQIYAPKLTDTGWECERTLTGPETNFIERSPTPGIDALDALTTTLKRVTIELEHVSTTLGRKVTWLGIPLEDLI